VLWVIGCGIESLGQWSCNVPVDEEENWLLRGRCAWRSVDVLCVVVLCCLLLDCFVGQVALTPS
jgi:hypothetical protein